MMATVFKKVKLGNKNKSETVNQNYESGNEENIRRRRVNVSGDTLVPCGRVCGLVNVCTGPADSMGNRRRRNRPQGRRNPHSHMTLFRSLQLRIDLWTSTTGHLLDRSFARRFCHRKSTNELYRSNSFRFEKFDKQEEDLQQQVSEINICNLYPKHLKPFHQQQF